MFIIYGLRNYNRRNGRTVFGACENCHHIGFQTSYDVTNYFHIYWVPLIPAGGHRVIEHCPKCKHSKQITKRQFEKNKKFASDLYNNAINHPGNSDTLAEALMASVGAENYAHFHALATAAQQHHPNNLDLLDKVAAGYAYFCRFDESQSVLLKILDQSNDDAYLQTAHTHSQAALMAKPKPPGGFLNKLPVLVVPVGAAIAAVVIIINAAASNPKHVYILNGLPEDYSVYVNGEPVTLTAGEPFQPKVHFGKNTISPAPDSPVFFEDIALDIQSSFFKRGRGGPNITVNPDTVAVVEELSFSYVVDEKKSFPEDRSVYHTNKSLMHWDRGIHFFFEEIPDEQPVHGTANYVTKRAVFQVSYINAIIQTSAIASFVNEQAAVRYARKVAGTWPDNYSHLTNALDWGTPEDNLTWLASHLGATPLRLEWHRSYQDLAGGHLDYETVRDYYRKLLESNPANPAYAYLLGRIQSGHAEARQLYQRSIQGEKPFHQGTYALCLIEAEKGNFAGALALLDDFMKSDPHRDYSIQRSTLLGYLGNWSDVKAHCAPLIYNDYLNFQYIPSYFTAIGALNLRSDADALLAKIKAEYREYSDPEDFDEEYGFVESYSECYYALGRTDKAAFTKAIKRMPAGYYDHWRHISEGRLADACNVLQGSADTEASDSLSDWLSLYLLASAKKDTATARLCLTRSVALLETVWRGEREIARMLKGEIPVSADAVNALQLNFAEKGLILASLATVAEGAERDKLVAAGKPFLSYPSVQHFLVANF